MAIYLDNAATTRVLPDVARAITRCLEDDYGNPSSAHRLGVVAMDHVGEARAAVLAALGDDTSSGNEILWTSGGTEGDALAVIGAAHALAGVGRHVVATAIEHRAVHGAVAHLTAEGYTTTTVPVSADGVVDVAAVVAAVTDKTTVVACMLVNNELGTIQPVREIARAVKAKHPRVQVHCDGVQGVGKLRVDAPSLGVDTIAISAHKFHGPKGAGALWLRKGARLAPIWGGGGQQGGLRSGTLNVPGIVGLATALTGAVARVDAEVARLTVLRDRLAAIVLEGGVGAFVNGAGAPRAPHILSLGFPGAPAEPMLHALEAKEIFVSAGSACASRTQAPSHVLAAIHLPEDVGALRLSLACETTADDVERAGQALLEAARAVRGPA